MAVYVEARRHVPSGFCYVSYVWQFRVCGVCALSLVEGEV